MDLVAVVKNYLHKISSEVSGIKALFLDDETMSFVSMVYSQTEILGHQFFLVDTLANAVLDENNASLHHVKAVILVQPSLANIRQIQQELRAPRFAEYHLFFSNLLTELQIEELARADSSSKIVTVQEIFLDYLVFEPHFFSLNVPSCAGLLSASWDHSVFQRLVSSLTAVLLSLKKRPEIRYQKNSDFAASTASQLHELMETERDLFAFRSRSEAPLLLILDRRNDALTPLLNQWTYQAMVHELIGINKHRVILPPKQGDGSVNPANSVNEVLLDSKHDEFFRRHMHANFGDIGMHLKDMLQEFQKRSAGHEKLQTIEDMQRFVLHYGDYRKQSGNAAKHVALTSELSRRVECGMLLECSQAEQEMACVQDIQSAFQSVVELLNNAHVSQHNKLRLVLLFALRYEREGVSEIARLRHLLEHQGVPPEQIRLIKKLQRFAGAFVRSSDIFSKNFFAAAKNSIQRGVKGVANVYTQFTPLLKQTLDNIVSCTLSPDDFPLFGVSRANDSWRDRSRGRQNRPSEIIIVMLGGVTYQEEAVVSAFNQANPRMRVVLGGTCVLNSHTFLEEVDRTDSTS